MVISVLVVEDPEISTDKSGFISMKQPLGSEECSYMFKHVSIFKIKPIYIVSEWQ